MEKKFNKNSILKFKAEVSTYYPEVGTLIANESTWNGIFSAWPEFLAHTQDDFIGIMLDAGLSEDEISDIAYETNLADLEAG